eukprot:scaffold158161_cov15-Tisochrysis_lutea.AAC.1
MPLDAFLLHILRPCYKGPAASHIVPRGAGRVCQAHQLLQRTRLPGCLPNADCARGLSQGWLAGGHLSAGGAQV